MLAKCSNDFTDFKQLDKLMKSNEAIRSAVEQWLNMVVELAPKDKPKDKLADKPKDRPTAKPKFKDGDYVTKGGDVFVVGAVAVDDPMDGTPARIGYHLFSDVNGDRGWHGETSLTLTTKPADKKPSGSKKASGTKKPKAELKEKPEPKAKAEPAPKPEKEKKPTKADLAQEAYDRAKKTTPATEEIKHIKVYLANVVAKPDVKKALNSFKALQRAITSRKIRKTSPFATQIDRIQGEYIKFIQRDGKLISQPDSVIAEYVNIVGGERVYKSVEFISRFVGWQGLTKTKEQMRKLLVEIKNAKAKLGDGDPYVKEVKQIEAQLEKVGTKESHTFKAESDFELSGLAGLLGCACPKGGNLGAVPEDAYRIGTKLKRKSTDALVQVVGYEAGKTTDPYDYYYVCKVLSGKAKGTTAYLNEDDVKPLGLSGTGKKPRAVLPDEKPANTGGRTAELPTKSRWPKRMSSHEMGAIDYPMYNFRNDPSTNEWGTLFGQPQNPFTAMFSGSPGAGKSTLLMQLAVYLSRHFGPTLYVSSEEYPSLTLADKLERAGGAVKGLEFSKTVDQVSWEHKFVIIDSSTHVGLTLKEFLSLKERYPSTSFILILQYTKGGKFRGGNEWPHEVDAVFYIDSGTVFTTKNRFIREPGTIQVFKED